MIEKQPNKNETILKTVKERKFIFVVVVLILLSVFNFGLSIYYDLSLSGVFNSCIKLIYPGIFIYIWIKMKKENNNLYVFMSLKYLKILGMIFYIIQGLSFLSTGILYKNIETYIDLLNQMGETITLTQSEIDLLKNGSSFYIFNSLMFFLLAYSSFKGIDELKTYSEKKYINSQIYFGLQIVYALLMGIGIVTSLLGINTIFNEQGYEHLKTEDILFVISQLIEMILRIGIFIFGLNLIKKIKTLGMY